MDLNGVPWNPKSHMEQCTHPLCEVHHGSGCREELHHGSERRPVEPQVSDWHLELHIVLRQILNLLAEALERGLQLVTHLFVSLKQRYKPDFKIK